MSGDTEETTRLQGTSVGTQDRDRVSLVVYRGDGVTAVELAKGAELVVGRSSGADVQIDLKILSRRHARFIRRDDDIVEVVDLDSRNGTFIAGERVARVALAPSVAAMLGDPRSGIAVVVERLHAAVASSPKLLAYDEFRAELSVAVDKSRAQGEPLSLLMLRARLIETRANLSHWATDLLGRIGDYRAAGVCDARTLLILLAGQESERTRALATKLAHSLAEWQLSCGIACLPGAAATGEELLHTARRACMEAGSNKPVVVAELDVSFDDTEDDQVVIQSPAMSELYRLVQRVAPTDVTVLILGETGAGKEVIANTVHRLSARADGPFRTVNCAAIPPTLVESTLFGHERGAFTSAVSAARGVFEQADRGTLFLDEIGELSPPMQAALLRVLETKRITRVGSQRELQLDVRIVAATHRDIEAMADRELFRRDLWFRLSAIELRVAPLRERREEIAPLAHHFLRHAGARFGCVMDGIEADAVACLLAYHWPGNLRELRNVIERAVLLAKGPSLGLEDLPERVRRAVPEQRSAQVPIANGNYHDMVRDYEVRLITEGLRIAEGNQTNAARLLKIPLRTLSYKMRQYGIKAEGTES
jgi:DNA-binding NtrC family response regulator